MSHYDSCHSGMTRVGVLPFINSLAPRRWDYNIKLVIFSIISRIDIFSISCEIAHKLMPQCLTDDESTLVQVMACCPQATNHYLNQCWPISTMLYDITRPQWVNNPVKNISDLTKTTIKSFKLKQYSRGFETAKLTVSHVNLSLNLKKSCHFADYIFRSISMKGKFGIFNQI